METLTTEAPAKLPVQPSLQERILARTSPTRQAARGQPYNYPSLWYGKPDGSIVLLAGDPQNRAYYEDKGFCVLRPAEAEEWEQTVRPTVLETQREKAMIITTIRRLGSKHPGVEIVDNLDDLDIPDLKEFLTELGKVTGAPVKVLAKRFGTEADRQLDDAAAGIPVRSGAELNDKLQRAAARTGR